MNDSIKSDNYLNAGKLEIIYLEAIFDKSADGLLICDRFGRILKMNKSAERLNGVKASEVLGKDVRRLVQEGHIDRSATQEVLETGRQVSVVQATPGSDYTLLVTGTPVFDSKNEIEYVVVNERDISLIENMRQELARARRESEEIKSRLTELTLLELKENDIVAQSSSMKHTIGLALKLAGIDASNILIQGESGTGKGLLAKFIHKHGPRNKEPFIQINCAALPENLLEAELFGYERGAFTGARETGKPGLFQLSSGGTLFLDEIAELTPAIQAKLLKCLDDHEIMPIGGTMAKKVDCSIIAATNRNLEQRVLKRKFRLDLLHRLNTFTISIPPLRERPEDILELVAITLKKCNKQYSRRAHLGQRGFEALKAHSFPGNVRELVNIIKQAVVMSERRVLDDYIIHTITPLPNPLTDTSGNASTLSLSDSTPISSPSIPKGDSSSKLPERLFALEHELLMQAAAQCRTTREAAVFLGISQPSVVRKMQKHDIVIKNR
ncbi:PAS modulated sigma54 specific transcriptional regulator, Fis family [Desulfamplus magnetovallimortis]|uniref:PAS modulated sigma54 specific transcriptional regulator, Fis family n=1 Tax=Desulfamplus magnetovallimortis TaxID=1246637 RepID=A0A1W1H7N6_9BACT|nr:sigma 54-interacting transcriptional regulator [Desulfamplus magnetovallimortis]SLM28463.1 PAS modulated sigma54 specific transcriptional regulator, Fis family [Desulfamplus magnetovallimortis]